MPQLLFTSASGESFDVRTFRVEEGLSMLFDVSVRAMSPNHSIDLEAVVGQKATFTVDTSHPTLGKRVWSGICASIEQVMPEPTGLSTYDLHLVPALWLLTQKRNYRIFQHKTAVEIGELLLSEWSIVPVLAVDKSRYPKLEYRVQYGETDFDFLCRTLEEAGIVFHYAEVSAAGATLTFADGLHARAPRPGAPLKYVDKPDKSLPFEWATRVELTSEVRPGGYLVRDFDFRRPRFPLLGEATKAAAPEDRYEQYHYQPGGFVVEGKEKGGDTPAADDQSVARADDKTGSSLAERALAGIRARKRVVTLHSNSPNVVPGSTFHIDDHPHAQLGSERLLLAVAGKLSGRHDSEWDFAVDAVYADVPYEPLHNAAKPVVSGVESATVVGPSGQEIYTDEFGRVRLMFPWDREAKGDGKCSCWVRVNQGWAGTGFGVITVPRIGQEVLVGFLSGDPDQPIVVGRVFNAKNTVPYKLPDHKTRSTWKSDSTPNAEGFNEVMFEDLAGQELVWMHAQKNLRKLVKNDELITVGHDRTKLVKGDEVEITGSDRTELVEGDRVEITVGKRLTVVSSSDARLVRFDSIDRVEGERVAFVGTDEHVLVQGERIERVEKNDHLRVLGSRIEQIGGSHAVSTGSHDEVAGGKFAVAAGTSYHVKASSSVVIEAPDVTFKAAGGFIRIDPGGVTIQGIIVRINSGGAAGSASDAAGGSPKKPREAEIADPKRPEIDDLTKTGIGQ
jgi:type VI secretion system secreted protein VgrG